MKRTKIAGARAHKIISLALAAILAVLIMGVAAPRSAAQNDGIISGTILDITGKPWVGITMQSVSDQGAKQETKTDKDGNYIFRNLKTGIYHVYTVFPPPNQSQPYDTETNVRGGTTTTVNLNFKEIAAKQGAANQEAVKKQQDEKQAAESMKAHFVAGKRTFGSGTPS